ncbi:TonB-dependent receptor [Sandaracinobacteroides saxicola]|uniref:TonB-dependent receptor n=1 Tax=Sandaracinobacteroides saxicola TaxID=2759707 RepID=A0A7G5ILI3_9SPHN|nr:TonB-dependent receptor [Sandaracinobacteroides saxicola]QMW24225.1 TonB-dependent receptor [Sandaracinobacteroides saxicola]
MTSQITRTTRASIFAVGAALLAAPVWGQAAAPQPGTSAAEDLGSRDEIVVTARKRQENVQDVPIAITALGAAQLEAARIEDGKDLQFNIPNVTFSANRNVTIRGVGSQSFGGTSDTNIGVIFNSVFLQSGSSFGDFFDMERIEVLRGPQGTLFGRNTTGGVIAYVTRRPTDSFEGYVNVQGDLPRGVRADGAINFVIAPGLSQRFAASYINRRGYTRNLLTGKDVDGRNQYTLRSSTRFAPSSDTTIDLTLSYFHENSNRQNAAKSLCTPDPAFGCSPNSVSTAFPQNNFGIDSIFLPGVVRPGTYAANPADLREVRIDIDPVQKAHDFLGTLEINQTLGDFTLTSVTGFRDGKNSSIRDFDQGYRPNAFNPGTFGSRVVPNDGAGNGVLTYLIGPGQAVTTTDYRAAQTGGGFAKQFSQEVRLTSNLSGPFNFIVGAFYLNARGGGNVETWLPANTTRGAISLFDTRVGRVKSYAAFGEANINITPTLKLTAGLRFTHDDKHIETASGTFALGPYFIGDASFEKLTGRAILNWNPRLSFTDDTNLYLSFSRGFKSGGFNPGNTTSPTFGSEVIDAYELGSKNVLPGGMGRINIALFNYEYGDLIVGNLVGTSVANTNIPKSRVRGAEIEGVLTPVSTLRFEAALGLLDTEIRSDFLSTDPSRGGAFFQLRGNQLPNAPRRTLKLAAEYTAELGNDWSLRPRVDFYSQSGFFSREFNVGADRVGTWQQLDLSVQLASSRRGVTLTGFVKNVLNDDAITFLETNSNLVGSFRSAFLLDPRTFGLALNVGFR